jgi:hypothetical protein
MVKIMLPRPRRTIIPQYSAPADTSLLAAAELLGDSRRAVAAQTIDLVVRKAISLSPSIKRHGRNAGFTLTLRSVKGLGDDELDLLRVFFPRLREGDNRTIARGKNRYLGQRLKKPQSRALARLVASGRARRRNWFEIAVTPWRRQPVSPTPAGYPTVDYLWGIRDYIALAEKDRLAYLQSPRGAELREDVGLGAQVLLLNEKLLPYAVLFGLEKEWMRELDLGYRSVNPADFDTLGVSLDLLAAVDLGSIFDTLELIGALGEVLYGAGAVVRVAVRAVGAVLDLAN